MWRRVPVVRQAKLNLVRFARIKDRPHLFAGGSAIGIFVGMTPTMGLQMPIAVFIAFLLKQNKLAAALCVWITNPLSAPFIYALEYEVGRLLMGFERASFPTEMTFAAFGEIGWQVIVPLWLGGMLFAIVCTPLAYIVALWSFPLFRRWRIPRWPNPARRRRLNNP